MVCTISGTTITAGTDTQLSTTGATGNLTISAVLLDTNKIFVAFGIESGSNLFAIVCTVSGTTITIGTTKSLSTSTRSGARISTIKLSNNRVFIAHSYGTYYYLRGMVCTISGDTMITAGTDTELVNQQYAGHTISAVLLDTDKVFIAHSYSSGSSRYLYGMVCTISGTTITVGTDAFLSDISTAAYAISAVLLDTDKIFIAHSRDSNYYLYGMVCTISGTTITVGTDTELVNQQYAAYTISAVLLDTDKVFIAHSRDSNYCLYGMVCTISGITITVGADAFLSDIDNTGYPISAVLLDTNKVFIAHNYGINEFLYGAVANYKIGILPITQATQQITGVAKTSGTSGDTIQVYVPDYN